MIDIEHMPIRGYEKYLVTSMGQVWSSRSRKYLKNSYNQQGHVKVELWSNHQRKVKYVHRLVAESFIPMVDGYDIVNHLDGDPSNNCVENLEWTNRSGNILHALKLHGNFNSSRRLSKQCKRGHDYSSNNTKVIIRKSRNNYRECQRCKDMRDKKRKGGIR